VNIISNPKKEEGLLHELKHTQSYLVDAQATIQTLMEQLQDKESQLESSLEVAYRL